jgi:nucleoside phosphorylase
MNHFIITAIAEKISALTTEQYFKDRGALSPDRDTYLKMLANAPDVAPVSGMNKASASLSDASSQTVTAET